MNKELIDGMNAAKRRSELVRNLTALLSLRLPNGTHIYEADAIGTSLYLRISWPKVLNHFHTHWFTVVARIGLQSHAVEATFEYDHLDKISQADRLGISSRAELKIVKEAIEQGLREFKAFLEKEALK